MAKIPNMNQMIKMAQNMAKDLEEKMNNLEVEGNSGGGMVKVTMNGHKQLLDLHISPEVIDPDDAEMLQDLIIAAFNDAQAKVDDEIKGDMGGLGGMLPGMPGMPGGMPFGM